MAKSLGRLATVEISLNGGSSYNAIGRLTDPTLALEKGEVDVTDHDSGAWEEILPGRKRWSIDAPVRADEADAGQIDAMSAYLNDTLVKVRFRLKGAGSGNKQFVGDAYVMSAPRGGPNGDSADGSFAFRGTSSIAETTQ